MNLQKCFIVVDGNSFIYRAYHATKHLKQTTLDGVATGAINGVLNMIHGLAFRFIETPIIMVFDSEEESFRKTVYPEYKANRATPPDELLAQLEPIHELIRAMGLPVIIVPGVEADDVIGTLAQDAIDNDHLLLICTGDKDMAQLVCDKNVRLLDTMRNMVTGEGTVEQKFGVRPDQIIDYLALVGDTVDNIPGLKGVGGKTAAQLLNAMGTIDNMLDNLDEVRKLPIRNIGAVADSLEEQRPIVKMSQFLATIKRDVPLDVTLETIEYNEPEYEALLEYIHFYELDQNPMMRRLFY